MGKGRTSISKIESLGASPDASGTPRPFSVQVVMLLRRGLPPARSTKQTKMALQSREEKTLTTRAQTQDLVLPLPLIHQNTVEKVRPLPTLSSLLCGLS